MATLAIQDISLTGLTPAYVAAAGGGDQFVPDADTFLHVKNGGGSPITITVVTPGNTVGAGALAIADVAVSVTNAQERMIGTFPYELFAAPATGFCAITYSAVTSVTIGAFRARRPS